MSIEVVVARRDAHSRHLLTVAAHGEPADQGLLAKCAVVIVHEEQTRRGVRRNHNVWPAIFIHVERHSRKSVRRFQCGNAGSLRYICESAVAVIAIERMGWNGKSARAAVDRNSLIRARRYVNTWLRRRRQIEFDVIRHK